MEEKNANTNVNDVNAAKTTDTRLQVNDAKKHIDSGIGDRIEHAGDKLKEKGASRVGQAVHNVGDRIEHMGEGKDR